MAILNMLGKWLDGSGWSNTLVEAGVGMAAAFLSACTSLLITQPGY